MPPALIKKFDLNNIPYWPFVQAGLVINLLVIVFSFVFQKALPPEIPLFYGLAEGGEQLTSSIFLFVPSAVALLILIANIILASFVSDVLIKKILIVAGITATFFATITGLKIFFLIASI